MSGDKHFKTSTPSDKDLRENPGIGTSKGTSAHGDDPLSIEGDNTLEGDVENDVTPQGGIDPNQLGRTNR